MMFHNDSLATLSAGNYAYWRIWDRNDICVVFPKTNIWTLPLFSDIVEGTLKFLTEINNRFGFKPNVYIVTVAEVRTLPQKQWGAKELCNLRGKSWSNRKQMDGLSNTFPGKFIFLTKRISTRGSFNSAYHNKKVGFTLK